MTIKKNTQNNKIDFNLIGQLITALAIELEKVAPSTLADRAKENDKSLRRHLARGLANEVWTGENRGFSKEWKTLRLQFISQCEPYICKKHEVMDPAAPDTVKDIERWAFNDMVEFWAKNSEKE